MRIMIDRMAATMISKTVSWVKRNFFLPVTVFVCALQVPPSLCYHKLEPESFLDSLFTTTSRIKFIRLLKRPIAAE